MIRAAIILFAFGAVGGLMLAFRHFRKETVPTPLALIHGLFGAAGLVTLALSIWGGNASGQVRLSLFLFLAAALGGFCLFIGFHLRKKRLPTLVVVLHALLALAGFGLLVAGFLMTA